MRTVNLLLSVSAIIITITTSCSKSSSSNAPGDLLTAHPWKLQKTDTLFHDASGTVTHESMSLYADCATRPNLVFSKDHNQSGFIGCTQPLSLPDPGYNWNLSGDQSNILTIQSSIRSGSPYVTVDSVIKLTTDSLILVYLQSSPYNVPQNDYTRSLLIHRWYTR